LGYHAKMNSLLSILLSLLPAQVCGTADLSWAVITASEFCPAATSHLCYVGEYPAVWLAVACCNGSNICHIDDDGVCGRGEREACRLPMP
jgi:hypothetical protein